MGEFSGLRTNLDLGKVGVHVSLYQKLLWPWVTQLICLGIKVLLPQEFAAKCSLNIVKGSDIMEKGLISWKEGKTANRN